MAAGRKYDICAHRGLSGVMPENTLPSFAAAIALGADEIEFDVRAASDGRLIVCHDDTIDRVSDRNGHVDSYPLDDLITFNAGEYMNWNVHFCTPEQVFELFANRVRMNIHVDLFGMDTYIPSELRKLLYHWDAVDSAYFSARGEDLEICLRAAPDVERCSLMPEAHDGPDIVDYAARYACRRVQFRKPYFNQSLIDRAHGYDMICNGYWADDKYETRRMLDMKMDVILTNRADVLINMKA